MTINMLSDFLGHPFVISLFSILCGSYFINKINYIKTTRDIKRNEALKLVNEISEKINSSLSWLYIQIRSENSIITENLKLALSQAHSSRLKFRVSSKFYFGSVYTIKEYEEIICTISSIKNMIEDPHTTQLDIKAKLLDISKRWNIYKKIDNNSSNKELFTLAADIVWDKSDSFLTSILFIANNIK